MFDLRVIMPVSWLKMSDFRVITFVFSVIMSGFRMIMTIFRLKPADFRRITFVLS